MCTCEEAKVPACLASADHANGLSFPVVSLPLHSSLLNRYTVSSSTLTAGSSTYVQR